MAREQRQLDQRRAEPYVVDRDDVLKKGNGYSFQAPRRTSSLNAKTIILSAEPKQQTGNSWKLP